MAHNEVQALHVIYLFNSEEQRESLLALANRAGDDFPSAHDWLVVIRSQEDELAVAVTQAEQVGLGRNADVIDLRNR